MRFRIQEHLAFGKISWQVGYEWRKGKRRRGEEDSEGRMIRRRVMRERGEDDDNEREEKEWEWVGSMDDGQESEGGGRMGPRRGTG